MSNIEQMQKPQIAFQGSRSNTNAQSHPIPLDKPVVVSSCWTKPESIVIRDFCRGGLNDLLRYRLTRRVPSHLLATT